MKSFLKIFTLLCVLTTCLSIPALADRCTESNLFSDSFEEGPLENNWFFDIHNYRGIKDYVSIDPHTGSQSLFMKGSDWSPEGGSFMETVPDLNAASAHISFWVRDLVLLGDGSSAGHLDLYLFDTDGNYIFLKEQAGLESSYFHLNDSWTITSSGIKLSELSGWIPIDVYYNSGVGSHITISVNGISVIDTDLVNEMGPLSSITFGVGGQYYNTGEVYVDDFSVICNQVCDNILYSSAPLNSVDYDLYQRDIEGAVNDLLLDDNGDGQMFHWSNDFTKIVYSTNGGSSTGEHELFIMDSDGTNKLQLTSFGDYWGQSYPRFVNESTIWWARPQIDEICSINIDGSGYGVLTNFQADGKSIGQIDIQNDLIVYSKQSKSVATTFDIYSNNLSFTNEQRLTSNSVADVGPEISPDGSKILFVRSTASNGYSSPKNIFIMNADGSSQTQLTFATGSQTYGHPLWSEDGTQILCYFRDGLQNDIYSFNPDGSGITNITNTPNYNEAPYDWRNFCLTESEGMIAGVVSNNAIGLYGIPIDLFDEAGELVASVNTDDNGKYDFPLLDNGTYTVSITPPLGFMSVSEVLEIIVNGQSYQVDFEIIEGSANKLRHIWWWKIYLDDLRNDGPRVDEFTKDDVNQWLKRVYDHYYNRTDQYAIQIENVTYKGVPAQPMIFDELAVELIDTHEGTYESYVRQNLLVNLLNVASGKMLQTKVVTVDGATASQAITHFYQVYETNKNENNFDERNLLIKAYLDLRKMHMGQLIQAGIVPLTTPNVMYKGGSDGDELEMIPAEFTLTQNYPNPFNPTTTISFSLPKASDVSMIVYNVNGQVVKKLVNGQMDAGVHTVTWDATNSASGIYFYKLVARDFAEKRKMLLLK